MSGLKRGIGVRVGDADDLPRLDALAREPAIGRDAKLPGARRHARDQDVGLGVVEEHGAALGVQDREAPHRRPWPDSVVRSSGRASSRVISSTFSNVVGAIPQDGVPTLTGGLAYNWRAPLDRRREHDDDSAADDVVPEEADVGREEQDDAPWPAPRSAAIRTGVALTRRTKNATANSPRRVP